MSQGGKRRHDKCFERRTKKLMKKGGEKRQNLATTKIQTKSTYFKTKPEGKTPGF